MNSPHKGPVTRKMFPFDDVIMILRPWQNGRQLHDGHSKSIFLNENISILIKSSRKSVSKGPIKNITALVQILAYRRPGDKPLHYNGVIMGAMTSQITNLTIVYSSVYWGADQKKHQSSASLGFVWGIHRWPSNSPHKGPVTRKIFPFDDVIMTWIIDASFLLTIVLSTFRYITILWTNNVILLFQVSSTTVLWRP